MPEIKEFIGTDLDGTLAESYWHGTGEKYQPTKIGDPIPAMVARIKHHLAQGDTVKIFTARAYYPPNDGRRHMEAIAAVKAIKDWCKKHIGRELDVTAMKEPGMTVFYDDRAKQVVPEKGLLVEDLVDLEA